MRYREPNPISRPARAAVLAVVFVLTACGGDATGPTEPPPTITTSALADGVLGEVYTEGVNATGGSGALSWTVVTGALPPGLQANLDDLGESDLVISGTPQEEGTFEFRIEAEDGAGRADTAAFSITILPPPEPVAVTTPALPPALDGAVYRVTLRAAGGDARDYRWSVVEGALPPGLELSTDGEFSGVASTPDTSTFTVEVESGGETHRRTFTLAVVEERSDRFNITTFAVVEIPPGLRANVEAAVQRWEAAIVGDLRPVSIPQDYFEPSDCGGFGDVVNGTATDDVLMVISIDSIDGPGQILGQAGPCAVRGADTLPYVGALVLDEADLSSIDSEETVTDLIQHEMGHVLGFGTLWPLYGLLVDEGSTDPRYIGEQAAAEYQDAGGATDSIPVENEGGEGTRDSHWRESVFDRELMTGFAERPGVDMFLSEMTIASFADLGYRVDVSAADDVDLLSTLLYGERDTTDERLGYDVAGIGRIHITYDDGTRTIVRAPGGP
ncbi:MAG: putative Ig domain-containing protein [Gemmatimonadota bacterium]